MNDIDPIMMKKTKDKLANAKPVMMVMINSFC